MNDMHKKYAKDGLVAMNVSLDDPADERLMKNVRDFLKEKKVDFPSFVLNEKVEYWQEKLDMQGPPAIFVFGKDGKRVGRFGVGGDKEGGYPEIEKLVRELLKK